MLLEVVLAVAILAGALAVIGGQINGGFVMNIETEVLTDAVFLAEAKMAEIDSGLVTFEEEMEGDFGEGFAGYGWRILIEPNEIEDLFEIEIQILRGEKLFGEEDYTYDEQSEIIHRVHTLRARPATLDLVRDFGISDEQMVELSDSIPIDGIDLTNLDPSAIARLDFDQLMELFGALGGGLESLLGMPGVAQRVQDALGGGDLEELLNNLGAGGQGGDAGGAPGNQGGEGSGGNNAESGESTEELPTLEELEQMLEQDTLGGQRGNRGQGGRGQGGRGQGGRGQGQGGGRRGR
jgi:hypothetical protein